MSNRETVVIIPAFNEEATIGSLLDNLKSNSIDIILVNDGSEDRTLDIAKSKGITIINHNNNEGYESAISSGIQAAINERYKFAVTFDADGQISVSDLMNFIKTAQKNNFDLIVGIRDKKNRYSENLLAILSKYRFGILDPLCGMKLYKLDIAKTYLPFDQNGLIGMELAFKMIESDINICQLPITIKERKDKSRFGSNIEGEIYILKSFIKVISLFGLKNGKT